MGAGQGEYIVAAVLDHRHARVAEQFLDQVILAEPVGAEELDGITGDLESGFCAKDFSGNCVFERRRLGRMVVDHGRAGECSRSFDLREHVEQPFAHQLMVGESLSTLHPLLRVAHRLLVSGPRDTGEHRRHRRRRRSDSTRKGKLIAGGADEDVLLRNTHIVEEKFTLSEVTLANFVEDPAVADTRKIQRNERDAAARKSDRPLETQVGERVRCDRAVRDPCGQKAAWISNGAPSCAVIGTYQGRT